MSLGTRSYRAPHNSSLLCQFVFVCIQDFFFFFIPALQVLTLLNVKDALLLLRAHAEIPAIQLLMPEPMRQQRGHAGDSLSHNITELQIGGLTENYCHLHPAEDFWRRINYLFELLEEVYSTLATLAVVSGIPEGSRSRWATFKRL